MCVTNYCTKVFVCLGPFCCFIVDNEVEAYVVPDQSVVCQSLSVCICV